MTSKWFSKAVVLAGALSMAASPLAITAAAAQDQGYQPPPPDQGGYNNDNPGAGYGDSGRYQGDNNDNGRYDQNDNGGRYQGDNGYQGDYRGDQAYDDNNPPPPPAPPDYDGTRLPPPPPGYQGPPESYQTDLQDRMYAERAEEWARENCVRAHGDPAAGAVVGGIIGALIGSGVAAGGHRTTGAIVGGAIGAAGGAAIAGSTDTHETSPGCPPGYVARGGAPEFYAASDYFYAAPGWYRPWVYYGDEWVYRPYPYHVWYYNRYYRGRHWDHDRDDWRDRDRGDWRDH